MSATQRHGLVKFRATSAADVIHKLRRELQRIESADDALAATDHVTNAFCTAWCVHQWMWNAIKGNPDLRHVVLSYRGIQNLSVPDAEAFGSILARRFVPLNFCRLIATSSRFVHVEPACAPGVSTPQAQDGPMIVVLGRPMSAIRLLIEIDDYWVAMILDCGLAEQ